MLQKPPSRPRLNWRAAGHNVGFPPPPENQITRLNAQRYPFTGWTYQHMRELFPTRLVARGGGVDPLVSKPVDFSGLIFPGPDGSDMSWAEFEAETHTDAMLVLLRGELIYENYFNGMKPHSQHLMFSITKSFVGLMAEILIHDGILAENANITTLIPELRGSAWEPASIRDLMDMRDGVSFDEDYANPRAEVHKHSLSWGWGPPDKPAPRGIYEALPALKNRFGPAGGGFRYRSAATDVLGWAVARAANQTLADLVSERVWQHLGVEHDGAWCLDLALHETAAAGLNMTARDLARFGRMMAQKGYANGRQIVPEAVIASIAGGGDNAAFLASDPIAARAKWSYRSQFWCTHDRFGVYNMFGVCGQRVLIDPTHDLVLVRFGSNPVFSNVETQAIHDCALAGLYQAIL